MRLSGGREAAMAGRRIGQEDLITRPEPRSASSLAELAALLDWAEIDRHLVGISAAAKGEPGWPPLALFRGLLLATWHDLSDVRLAEALNDRASFRRFCGFAAHEPTPERTAFVRFRRELVARGLDRALFEAVTRQLEAKGVTVRTGTLVDATLIPSASIRADGEARWAGHRRRKPVHGYKAHVATDEDAGLVRGVAVTTANVHDAAELEAVLPPEPGEVYGDSAFAGSRAWEAIRARGGAPRVLHTHTHTLRAAGGAALPEAEPEPSGPARHRRPGPSETGRDQAQPGARPRRAPERLVRFEARGLPTLQHRDGVMAQPSPPPAPLQVDGRAVQTPHEAQMPHEAPRTRQGRPASRPDPRSAWRSHHPPGPRGAAPDRWVRLGRARIVAAHLELVLARAPGFSQRCRRPVPRASASGPLGRGRPPRPSRPRGRKPLRRVFPRPSLVSSAALLPRPKSDRCSDVPADVEAGGPAMLTVSCDGPLVSAIAWEYVMSSREA
jgi:transposase, IS5 family